MIGYEFRFPEYSLRAPLSVPERAGRYLATCDSAISGSGGHDTTFRVACAIVHGFGLNPEIAYQLLRDLYNPRCEPSWSDTELWHKIQSACSAEPLRPRGWLLASDEHVAPLTSGGNGAPNPETKAAYDPAYLEKFVEEFADVIVDDQYLELRSEFSCRNRSSSGTLHKVFLQGEHVWVTDNPLSREGLIWTHDGPVQDLSELSHLATGRIGGAWFLSNPIDGIPYEIERLKSQRNPEGMSFRATECVTSWRHAVLETDQAPLTLWLKALVLLELPIVAIYHSGSRGPHALANLGASTIQEWYALLEPHREHLIRLGACPRTLTPLRLTRLPGCMREETGRLQQLLYLCPDADDTPIARRPLREDPLAVWVRFLEAARFGRSDNP